MAAHLSALVAVAGLPFGHIVGPLIVYLVKAHESEFVAEHARASLNYQITVSIVGLIGILVAVGAMFGLIATGATVHSEDGGYAAGIVAPLGRLRNRRRHGLLVLADLHHCRNRRRQQRTPVHLSVCHPLFALGARTQHVVVPS